ncbi:uncharacterized protein LOC117291209 [Asterias rubens]|uniref:uncharacterized protein LOC117291209 n=1 Tax=Asterias rubens TaxID=7604 RepID=UPI001455CCCD|nr:uncharacterized protein LOC117291209 [Asterias rubens]XP_033628699.1 uncharacterized protein LOC117291209 [Asterias rubens]
MCSLYFSRLLSLACLLLTIRSSTSTIGYFEGGSIFWQANQTNPQFIQINFRLHFRLSYQAYLHEPCTQANINDGSTLTTEDSFYVNKGEEDELKVYASYVCTNMDQRNNWGTGIQTLQYVMPPGRTTATINYESCCWLGDIQNNGQSVENGKGWNLAATVNTDHGDGIINTPPLSSSFPMYHIMEGCEYTLPIPHFDANGDDVKCRWTSENRDECNHDDSDICGKIFYDSRKKRKVAQLNQEECTLDFPSSLPAGVYAVPVMLEDFSSSDPETPLSKVPVQFLVRVFESPGSCRLPQLEVPDDVCLTVFVGQEFRMSIYAIATSSQYRITDIIVLGLASQMEGPDRVQGNDAKYKGTLSFTPSMDHKGKHSFCVLAVEENDFWSEQSCFSLHVITDESQREQLRALPGLSKPERDSIVATDFIPDWKIRFNQKVKKTTTTAFFRVTNQESGAVVFEADTSGPDVHIKGNTMTFLTGFFIYLEPATGYTIHLDRGAVESADNCNTLSTEAGWDFTTKRFDEAYRTTKADCTKTDMTAYLSKFQYGEFDPETMHLTDPRCTGQDHNQTHYAITTGYGGCRTSFNRTSSDISFSNIIYIPDVPYAPGSEITRYPHREVQVLCHVPPNFINTRQFDPDVRINIFDTIEGEATPDHTETTTLRMYRDRRFRNEAGQPVDVPLNVKLYFQGESQDCRGGGGCDVFLESCWATVSGNPYDSPRHTFIENGCAVADTVTMMPTSQSWKSRFSVRSFAFLGARIHDRVNVHCSIAVCDSSDSQSVCSLGCLSPVSTREVGYNEVSNW